MDHTGFLQPIASRPVPIAARLLDGLADRPRLTGAAAALYLLVVVVTHDLMQRPAYWAQGQLSHRSWNNLVTGVSVPLLVLFCIWILVKLVRHPRRLVACGYLLTTLALMVVSFRTLLVMNIEVIHFPQYMILALLLFAVTGQFTATLIWATLAALVDEGYQYFYLYADRRIHFDFNDVLLDSIGAAFGLVALFIGLLPQSRMAQSFPKPTRNLISNKALWAAGATLCACTILSVMGLLRMLKDPDGGWAIVLRRGGPSTIFWTPTTWGKTYHELQPLEWLALTVLLLTMYAMVDQVRFERTTSLRPDRANA